MEKQFSALDSVELALARSASTLRGEMKRGIDSVASIAATAPLLGFLGTVLGIEQTFSRGFVGDRTSIRKWIVGSLGESLMPAALGLLVALLALGFYRYLSARLEELEIEMQNASLDLLNRLSRFPESNPRLPD